MTTSTAPRFFVPEVVQTSEMDCGPASLKALLEGFGIQVSYGRLREACQTQVDGTSIDTIEDVANQLGLAAEQIMLPADHLALPEADALPALVVVLMPNGLTHFVVVWNLVGPFVQLMDPGRGRRWTTWEQFARDLFLHRFPIAATTWREWASTDGFLAPLRRRMRDLGLAPALVESLVARAGAVEAWHALAALDASVRMMETIVRAGGVARGTPAAEVVTVLFERGGADVPAMFWFVTPSENPGEEETLTMRGALAIHVAQAQPSTAPSATESEEIARAELSPELVAALSEPPLQPERKIWDALKQDGWLAPSIIIVALLMATLGVSIEGLMLQALMRAGADLVLLEQRISAAALVLVFIIALFALEIPLSAAIQRLGRRIEARLRIEFLEKIPRLGDRYFHSRLTSDMANRAHSLASLRGLPNLAISFLRQVFQLVLTSVGVLYLDPDNAWLAILFSGLFIAITSITNPILEENSMRVGTLSGALSRFYLDALLGLIPLKTHGAERALRREHEGLVSEWMSASLDAARVAMYIQSASALLYAGFAIAMVFNVVARGGSTQGVLLLFYWTLNLPMLAQSVAQTIQQYPDIRNNLLRVLEPLGAPDESEFANESAPSSPPEQSASRGVAIEFSQVTVQAGGHTILSEVDLKIAAGEHVAIVGASGAGKSSLVGLLLGWHKVAQGKILVDGDVLDGNRLRALRMETAWVDPAVQLWNHSLLENLEYGNTETQTLAPLIAQAELYDVLTRLPDGLQTDLGESGGLVSGGEGQRVRLGRAMNRRHARLVILDEPLRGLDRAMRRTLLARARELWRDATLICITHDVGETQTFDRVLVVQDGKIIEDAKPSTLARRKKSRYRDLLAGDTQVRRDLWQGTVWRQVRVTDGVVSEEESKRMTVE